MARTILVTGGAGFVGSHIVDLLLEAGDRQAAVIDNMVRGRPDNLSADLGSGRGNRVQGDIRARAPMVTAAGGSVLVLPQ